MSIETPVGTVPDKRALDKLRARLATFNRELSATMTPVATKDYPFVASAPGLMNPPIRAWRSARFIACLYQEPGKPALRLSVCRALLNDAGQFDDRITWDELHQIKRECGYGAWDAVELYPRDGDVVNVSNMRHLWLLDTPSPLVWR